MSMGLSKTWLRVGIIAGLIVAMGLYAFWYSGRTYQYEEIEQNLLYRSGLRTSSEFVNACNESGCRTVLMLMGENEQTGQEAQEAVKFVFRNRLKYLYVPMPTDQQPTREQIKTALDWIAQPKRQPVLLFCTDGRRSAMVAAAYRLSTKHMSWEAVRELAEKSDLSPATLVSVTAFINSYATTQPTSNPVK